MTSITFSAQNVKVEDENRVRTLYQHLLDSWNQRDGHAFAILFEVKGHLIGYDGSQINGRTAIQTEMDRIFHNHIPAVYVAKVREVRFPTPDMAILRAVAGMVPRGQTKLNPGINAVQTLVAVKRDSGWQIALFQNTPVQFHDRPYLAQQLTEELSLVLKDSKKPLGL
jgi:uncharacterized protein (TIGR02246 family)